MNVCVAPSYGCQLDKHFLLLLWYALIFCNVYLLLCGNGEYTSIYLSIIYNVADAVSPLELLRWHCDKVLTDGGGGGWFAACPQSHVAPTVITRHVDVQEITRKQSNFICSKGGPLSHIDYVVYLCSDVNPCSRSVNCLLTLLHVWWWTGHNLDNEH